MRRRLLVSNVVLITIVLLALEIPLALIFERHERDSLNSSLQRDAISLAALSEEVVEHPGDHNIGNVVQRFTDGDTKGGVVILDRSGRELTPDSPIVTTAPFASALAGARAGRSASGEHDGLSYAAVPVGAAGDAHGAVLVARSDVTITDRIHQFWIILGAIALGVLAISITVSQRLARWAVDPLQRLEDHASRLGHGDLQARVDTSGAPPEIADLASTFNSMADQLDTLVTAQRRFVADASHQLRTPLTALRLRLENLDVADAASIEASREAALQETLRLTRLVDGLLTLARAEQRPEREPVDVRTVVAQRHEAWAPLAAEHQIDLRLEPDGGESVRALIVPGHLDQILDNLIDNAIDATPPSRSVRLCMATTPKTVEVHVVDEGPGMPDEERQRAFAPFWQGSHRPSNGSSGLGLAIVDQLARASHGTVVLGRATGGGLDAIVRLPRASD